MSLATDIGNDSLGGYQQYQKWNSFTFIVGLSYGRFYLIWNQPCHAGSLNCQSVHYVVTLVVNTVVSHAYSAHIGIAATNVLYSMGILTIQCLLMIKFIYLSVWFLLHTKIKESNSIEHGEEFYEIIFISTCTVDQNNKFVWHRFSIFTFISEIWIIGLNHKTMNNLLLSQCSG